MDLWRRLTCFANQGLTSVYSMLSRWLFQHEDTERELTVRLAQELVDSIYSIFQYFDDLEQSIEQELKKRPYKLTLEKSHTLLKVFEILDAKFKYIQSLQQCTDENEYTLSKRVGNQDCLTTLLDLDASFGKRIKTIKDHCSGDNHGFVIVNLTINSELCIPDIISKLYKICNILRNSQLGNLTLITLIDKGCEIRQKMSTNDENAEYADVCIQLEKVMTELRPMCDKFTSKVARMTTALETRFENEDE